METSEHFFDDPIRRREEDHRTVWELQEESHDDGLTQDEIWGVFSLGMVIEPIITIE